MATAALTGTAQAAAGGAAEADVAAGGLTIILTLTGDTWVATVGADNAITTALIAGIDSDLGEAAGWDAQVKTTLAFGDVTRDSDTVVTIVLPAVAGYSVAEQESITVTIPATALTLAAPLTASPGFSILPTGFVYSNPMMMGVGR